MKIALYVEALILLSLYATDPQTKSYATNKKLDHDNAWMKQGTVVVLETSGRLQFKVTRKSHFFLSLSLSLLAASRRRELGVFLFSLGIQHSHTQPG